MLEVDEGCFRLQDGEVGDRSSVVGLREPASGSAARTRVEIVNPLVSAHLDRSRVQLDSPGCAAGQFARQLSWLTGEERLERLTRIRNRQPVFLEFQPNR